MIIDKSVPTLELNRKINQLVGPPFSFFSSLSHGWNWISQDEYLIL